MAADFAKQGKKYEIFDFSTFSHIWIFGHMENVPRHILTFQFPNFENPIFQKIHCLPVSESPTRVRLVAAACGASATSEKNTPLEFWSVYLVDFVDFCRFQGPPSGYIQQIAPRHCIYMHISVFQHLRGAISISEIRNPALGSLF